MALKEKFIVFCEMQRSARETRERQGVDHPDTKEAYEKANDLKRQVLDMIEDYDQALFRLEDQESYNNYMKRRGMEYDRIQHTD